MHDLSEMDRSELPIEQRHQRDCATVRLQAVRENYEAESDPQVRRNLFVKYEYEITDYIRQWGMDEHVRPRSRYAGTTKRQKAS